MSMFNLIQNKNFLMEIKKAQMVIKEREFQNREEYEPSLSSNMQIEQFQIIGNRENLREVQNKYWQYSWMRKNNKCGKIECIIFVVLSCCLIIAMSAFQNHKQNEKYKIIKQWQKEQIQTKKQPSRIHKFIPEGISCKSLNVKLQKPTAEINYKQKQACLKVTPLEAILKTRIDAYSTKQRYICTDVQERFQQYEDGILSIMTAYNFFLTAMYDSNPLLEAYRPNILNWNRNRTQIEWILRNVKQGHKVLMIQNSSLNLISLFLASKIVGPSGSVTLVGPFTQSNSIERNMRFHSVTNIKFENKLRGKAEAIYSGYDIFIASQQLIKKSFLKSPLFQNATTKYLIYFKNSSYLQQIKEIFKISKYIADPYSCQAPLISSELLGQGYYEIASKYIQQDKQRVLFPYNQENSFFKSYFEKYKENKAEKLLAVKERYQKLQQIRQQCSCIDRNLLDRNENFTVSVYGNYLYGVSEDQTKAWEQEREAVEWVRGKLSSSSVVYYELRDFNILAIAEIGRILSKGKLIVFCKGNECNWIERQKRFEQISSIETIETSSFETATSSDAIITDNESMIDKSIAAGYLQKGKLLGYFTRERESSFKVFGKLVPMHNLWQIKLPSELGECRGFGYQNYFWDIDELNRFYEISLSSYQIFMYWSGSPSTLSSSRKNSIQQIIETSKVEVKVFNKDLFQMVQGIVPIHEGFRYLSAVHQSDYFRIYILHSFGGGYADVKHYHYDWRPYFKKLYDDPQKYAMGYPQRVDYHVACNEQHSPPSCYDLYAKYNKLIGNGGYLYKKNTILTQDAISRNHKTLDKKLQLLKANPASHPRDRIGNFTDYGVTYFSKYPLRWAELGGEVMSRVAYANMDRYLYDLPYFVLADYR